MAEGAAGGAGAGGRALYAPLSQLLSDSDSDSEGHKHFHRDLRGAESCNNLDINSGLHSSKNNNYSASDLEDMNTQLNTLETTMDNVSFLQSDISNKMSFARKVAFIASILVCMFTVVIFLWFIPCSEIGSCSANEWRDKTTSWELPYDEIELSGGVQVVDGAQPNSKNLIFIYRGNHMRLHNQNEDGIANGVLLIVGNSGKIGWYTRERRIPTEINCHVLDVNLDGRKDCIVSGSEGFLTAINPLSGTYYWYVQKKSEKLDIKSIDFPAVIKDVDHDKVSDLLTSATIWPATEHNSLLIISGASGQVLGEPLIIGDCASVHNIIVNSSFDISYSCRNNTKEAFRTLSYQQVMTKMLKDQSPGRHMWATARYKEHGKLSYRKKIWNNINYYNNGKGKLIVENSGECPEHCRVNLKLILERNGTANTSWEYAANHVYATEPSSFAFANSIHGFVLKL